MRFADEIIPEMKTYYKQRLPHFQPVGAIFFVTFRLFDSIPYDELTVLRYKYDELIANNVRVKNIEERKRKMIDLQQKYYEEYDDKLNAAKSGPVHLKNPIIANIVKEQLHKYDGSLYELICYTIMSNHVHMLISTEIQIACDFYEDLDGIKFTPLDQIMKKIKGPTAIYSNRILKRQGRFWAKESFDKLIHNERMLNEVVSYILNNPVKAKIAEDWTIYEHTYLASGWE